MNNYYSKLPRQFPQEGALGSHEDLKVDVHTVHLSQMKILCLKTLDNNSSFTAIRKNKEFEIRLCSSQGPSSSKFCSARYLERMMVSCEVMSRGIRDEEKRKVI